MAPQKRGLANASKATRQRVARMGGEASSGGGRKKPSSPENSNM